MLSRTQYRELMNSYQYMLEKLEHVAWCADENTRDVVSAGGECRSRSGRLVHQIEELCQEMRCWIGFFESHADVE